MILTSFRCYMNAIIPTTDKDVLLRSHYYVLDVVDDRYSNSVSYGMSGEVQVHSHKFNNNYRIEYVPEIFNPEAHTSDIQYINMPGGPCLANKQVSYMRHLMNTDTKYKVYNKLFSTNQISEYPKIMIMFDEENIINYGSMIATYMSSVFGVDIDFIDEALRPNVFGNKTGHYVGNVNQGRKTIRECKNGKIFKDMKLMIDENSRENTLSNMMSQLSGYSTEDLIYIYNIIFPDKPLCAGTYTRDDMFTILTGSMCDEIEFRGGYGYDDLSDNIGTYEQQLSEWEQMLDDDFRAELLEEADRAGV